MTRHPSLPVENLRHVQGGTLLRLNSQFVAFSAHRPGPACTLGRAGEAGATVQPSVGRASAAEISFVSPRVLLFGSCSRLLFGPRPPSVYFVTNVAPVSPCSRHACGRCGNAIISFFESKI